MTAPLLDVRGLTVRLHSDRGPFTAIEDVGLEIMPGEVLGVVGESGSGKSVTALTLLRLIPPDALAGMEGSIRFDGQELMHLPEAALRRVRGRGIGMVFQDPMTTLNPIASIGWQVSEPLRLHLGLGRRAAMVAAEELLDLVGIKLPGQCLRRFPHELSGGMRQRVVIAMALACNPKLVVADEATTALDVTTQAQILDLLRRLQAQFGMAVMMITHDLGLVAEFADRVQVMYAGRIVEKAPTRALFGSPAHPYAEGLLRSVPGLEAGPTRLYGIQGNVPSPYEMPPGCSFAPRCTIADEACVAAHPMLAPTGPGRCVACFHPRPGVPAW